MTVEDADLILQIDKLDEKLEEKIDEVQLVIREKRKIINRVRDYNLRRDLLSRMSHSLRTPLNSIIGFSDLLLEGIFGGLDVKQKEILEDIKESADALFRNVVDLIETHEITFSKYKKE